MKRKSFWLLLTAIIVFLSIFVLLLLNFTDGIDIYGKEIQKFFSCSNFETFFFIVTNLMSIVGIIIILIVTTYSLRKKDVKKDIILYIITILLCLALTNLIKIFVRRKRPLNGLLDVSGFSFPSSHSSIAVVVYGYLIILLNKYYQGKRKTIYILLCIFMILFTGISRIYFNVHYITDVIAGFSLGLILLLTSYLLMKKIDKFPKK